MDSPFDQKVGIGTTVASDPVKVTNAGKLSVGIVTSHSLFVSGTSHVKIPAGTTGYGFITCCWNEIHLQHLVNTCKDMMDCWGGGWRNRSRYISQRNNCSRCWIICSCATHRSASILAQIDQGANYQVGRYLMIHDGTTVTVVEEAAVATGDMLGSFSGDINHSNAELKVTMASSGIATVTTIIDKITI